MTAVVYISFKDGVLDPQGKTIAHALSSHGFGGVKDVKVNKKIELELEEDDEVKARAEVEKMCETLLANTVIENYVIEMKK